MAGGVRVPAGEDSGWFTGVSEDRCYYWHNPTKMTTWDQPLLLSPNWRFVSVFRGGCGGGAIGSIATTATAGAGCVGCSRACVTAEEPAAEPPTASDSHWVEVRPAGGRAYFWHVEGREVRRQLPAGACVAFQARQLQTGDYLYINRDTGEQTWAIPGAPICRHPWIQVGAAVLLTGLEDERFNGQSGYVSFPGSDRTAWVQLPDVLGDPELEVPFTNLAPLARGAIVELLNGRIATIHSHDPDQVGRLNVIFDDGSELRSLPSTEVRARSRLWEINFRRARIQGKEQQCLFIDSAGRHRNFSLHLPQGFSPTAHRDEGGLRWPLLFYMHTAGHGTFLTQGKKALVSTPGMQFAMSRFVIVSPQCDWTWKQMPRPWVFELLRHLRAAEWIDTQRVYITGCSMGGMGTWEVASETSGTLAAIAPVAAHHQRERTLHLAQRLSGLPILAVHSLDDDVCPAKEEVELWSALRQQGNSQLEVCVGHNVHHDSMFERALCDDTVIFEWLLSHVRSDKRSTTIVA